MVTLAELIAESKAANPDAFAKFGSNAFVNLNPNLQVSIANAVNAQAQSIRNLTGGASGTNDFIRSQAVNIQNLFRLGQSQIDISNALEENVKIRESQRKETFASINGLADAVASINERTSKQLTELGDSVMDISKKQNASDNPLGFLTNNPIAFGLGAGGLAVGALALFLILRK